MLESLDGSLGENSEVGDSCARKKRNNLANPVDSLQAALGDAQERPVNSGKSCGPL
jgi:hypothetical protein